SADVFPAHLDRTEEAEPRRQHHSSEDDADGQLLIAEAGMSQLLLDHLDLAFLEDLHPLQALFHLLGRVRTPQHALALLAAARDDAALQLVPPRIERLHALRHRVADAN